MASITVPDTLTPANLEFIEAMAKGIVSARSKYPGNAGRFVALVGESGEAFHAVQKILTWRGSVQELGAELRQVAQMACRLAVEGDPMFPAEAQAQFPIIVQPTTATLPHQPGHIG